MDREDSPDFAEELHPLTAESKQMHLLDVPGGNNSGMKGGLSRSSTAASDLSGDVFIERGPGVKKYGVNGRLIFAIAAAAFGSSFQHGYNIGVVNAPQKLIADFINETDIARTGVPLSKAQVTVIWSMAVAITSIGGMIGGCLTGYMANRFGRKGALLLNNIIVLIGATLEAFSKMAGSYDMITAGRFFIGLNSGLNAGLAPMYLSEISPVHLRGSVGTVYQLVITISILLSQIVGLDTMLGTEDKWPWLFALTLLPALFQMVTLPLCPESPKYILLNRGKEIEAQRALAWFRDSVDVRDEMNEMRHEYDNMKLVPQTSLREMVTNPSLRSPLIISVVIMIGQQLSGINAVMFFSTDIFEKAGLTAEAAVSATIAMGTMNVVITIISLFLVERAGRKTLLLIGFAGMAIATALLTIVLAFKEYAQWVSYVSILLIILFVIMFATGPGSIPWFLVTELFAQSARPMAASIAVAVNWGANFLVSIAFLPLQLALGSYVFIIFTGFLVVFLLFVYYKVPETKNKTVEEISALFRQRYYSK